MDSELLKKFRDKFTVQHIDPPSTRSANFDKRDVTRILEDDVYANAFLSWRKQNIDASVKLAADVFEWRKKHGVNDITMEDIGSEFYKKKGMFIRGKCKNGFRIVHFIGKRFTKDEEASAKKMYIYLLEKLQREDPSSKVTFILDAGECGMNNVDMGVIRLIVDSYLYYYPSMLGRTFIVDLPVILSAIWNMVKLWFDEELRSRTQLCPKKDLDKYIAEDQMVEILGGKDVWEPGDDCDEDIASEFRREDDEFADAVENLQIAKE